MKIQIKILNKKHMIINKEDLNNTDKYNYDLINPSY